MTTSDPDSIQPSFAAGEVPAAGAGTPVGDGQRVSDPDDETARADELISLEGPDVETSSAPDGSGTPDPKETDPLDPTPIDPDLEAPAQEEDPE
ncbi:MAG: hypothetical protein HY996_06740 [Micrococcales bacterium]|nr:hypothetical protein [Micrococcales bacterium]